jgi:hypothetical protein
VGGWFSFENSAAAVGDVLAKDVVCEWIDLAGLAYDVALAAPLEASIISPSILQATPIWYSCVDLSINRTSCSDLRSAIELESICLWWNPWIPGILLICSSSETVRRLHVWISLFLSAIDPIPYGDKIRRQAEILGWPLIFTVDLSQLKRLLMHR